MGDRDAREGEANADKQPERVDFEADGFAVTGEHRRFAEFCEDRRRYRDIGLCVGLPGVGKTASAKRYARWDILGPFFNRYSYAQTAPAEAASCHTVYYVAPPANTPKSVTAEIERGRNQLSWLVDVARADHGDRPEGGLLGVEERTELVIVDEAQFLKNTALEQLRYLYDRDGFGLVLVGMPGFDKALVRYPQFYSRVGFLHKYDPLEADPVRQLLRNPSVFGVGLGPGAFSDQAADAMIRHSGGVFRTLIKLALAVERILEINEEEFVDDVVVQLAREHILLGKS